MTRFPKELIENGIHYTLHGDYYFPDLDLPDSPRQTIGHYGRMRKAYLEEHHPIRKDAKYTLFLKSEIMQRRKQQ